MLTATNAGAGEILINSIDFDGAMTGFDIDAIKAITDVCECSCNCGWWSG